MTRASAMARPSLRHRRTACTTSLMIPEARRALLPVSRSAGALALLRRPKASVVSGDVRHDAPIRSWPPGASGGAGLSQHRLFGRWRLCGLRIDRAGGSDHHRPTDHDRPRRATAASSPRRRSRKSPSSRNPAQPTRHTDWRTRPRPADLSCFSSTSNTPTGGSTCSSRCDPTGRRAGSAPKTWNWQPTTTGSWSSSMPIGSP